MVSRKGAALVWAAVHACVLAVAAVSGVAQERTEAPGLASLEADARRALDADPEPFAVLAARVEALDAAAREAGGADRRGLFAWLRLATLQRLLQAVPFGRAEDPPYRAWLDAHRHEVVYSEPAGAWLIAPEAVWRVHDAHRGSASAEAIAWLAVGNGYPGECEGYVPCYANVLNWLHGEYLRRHPRGAHAAEALARIADSLRQSLRLVDDPSFTGALDPATDCGDLRDGLDPLRQAIAGATADARADALALLDALGARCPAAR